MHLKSWKKTTSFYSYIIKYKLTVFLNANASYLAPVYTGKWVGLVELIIYTNQFFDSVFKDNS